jgi:hypothetical protein
MNEGGKNAPMRWRQKSMDLEKRFKEKGKSDIRFYRLQGLSDEEIIQVAPENLKSIYNAILSANSDPESSNQESLDSEKLEG